MEEVYVTQRVDGGVVCAILLGEDNCVGVEGAELDDWNVEIDSNVPEVEEKVMPEVEMTYVIIA